MCWSSEIMTDLTILPVEYEGKRLEEVSEGILYAFPGLISDFKIPDNIPSYDLDSSLFYRHPCDDDMVLKVDEFLEWLSKKYDGPIMGVTSLSVDDKGEWIIGKVKGNVCLVSSNLGEETYDSSSEQHIYMLKVSGVHEFGHVFGLKHHRRNIENNGKIKKTCNDKPCPLYDVELFTSKNNRSWMNYFLEKDSILCRYHYNRLGISHPAYG